MRHLISITLLVLVAAHQATAQFMVIQTKKGYTVVLNYEQAPLDTLQNGTVIWCEEKNDKGLYITYMKPYGGTVGYLNPADALLMADAGTKIPVTGFPTNSLFLEKEKVKIEIEQKPFD